MIIYQVRKDRKNISALINLCKHKADNTFKEYWCVLLLLLLLIRFSRVRLCVTPYTAAHEAPPSLRFSRQEHRSGLPCPSPMHESEKWKGRQAPPSMGFSRQEYWIGLPLPSPIDVYYQNINDKAERIRSETRKVSKTEWLKNFCAELFLLWWGGGAMKGH